MYVRSRSSLAARQSASAVSGESGRARRRTRPAARAGTRPARAAPLSAPTVSDRRSRSRRGTRSGSSRASAATRRRTAGPPRALASAVVVGEQAGQQVARPPSWTPRSQPRWLSPNQSNHSSPGGRPSAAATRRHRADGVSQMPIARSPSTCWAASVTMPAGLVKLTSQPRGARAATCSASATIAGIVRSAKQIPPGPIVSWPSTPWPSGTASSTVRPSSWPTRTADEHEVGALDASSRSSVVRNGSRSPCSAAWPSSTSAMRSSRSESTSCRTTSSNGHRGPRRRSAPYTSGTRNPPPPMFHPRSITPARMAGASGGQQRGDPSPVSSAFGTKPQRAAALGRQGP